MLPPFDHRLMSHDTKFSILSTHSKKYSPISILSTHCVCTLLFEQLKSPLFNFFKKLPIIQKLFMNIWPRSTNDALFLSLSASRTVPIALHVFLHKHNNSLIQRLSNNHCSVISQKLPLWFYGYTTL